ncbi:MAG: glycerol acyltransferase [Sphingobacteriaceae bacterium]|nr:MAG: glycerol acyltransferase [Sphingobacteriaceae bacterium]
MVKDEYHWLKSNFFSWYISRSVRRHYHKIEFNPVEINPQKSILLVANHYSWWDGFLFFHLNKLLFKKKFHIIILEETIIKHGFLKYVGSFSVSKTSRSMLETLKYAGNLLDDPENLLVIFPQGKLYSNFVDEVNFEKGLERITGFSSQNFDYIFAASFTEEFSEPKPTVFIYLKNAPSTNFAGLAAVQLAYQKHYQQSKSVQIAIVK